MAGLLYTVRMSFFRHVMGKKYIRFLMALNAMFLIASMAGNYAAMRTSQQTAVRASQLFDIQNPPTMVEVGEVAGVQDSAVPTSTPAATGTPSTTTPSPADSEVQPVDKTPRKSAWKIAVFGDSMVDTMGEGLPYLEKALKKRYPDVSFTLYNYGMGAQNVEAGLERFNKPFSYKNRKYEPLDTLDADIIIVGSFAYNPFDPFDRDKHWLTLTRLVEKAKDTYADVYLLAEIAPLRSEFGKGPQGVNWDRVTAFEHSGKIIKQLENAVGLSKNLNVLLINAYEKSIVSAKNEGKREYVNAADGIHQSVKGQEFMAEEIAKSLILE